MRTLKTPEPGTIGHIPALDAVRGIAILLVLATHFFNYDGLPPPAVWLDRLLSAITRTGWIGVDLFFVLSGFLITGILYDAKGSGRYFRNFYARRVLRIFPVYYVSLLVFLVLLPGLYPEHRGLRALKADDFWYWTYLTNVQIAQHGFPWFGALGHFWSLAIEEQFYLVWPVVVFMFGRSSLIRVCAFCIVAAFVLRVLLMLGGYGTAAYVMTPARMDALAMGAGLALIARGPKGLTPLIRVARPAAGVLGAVLVAILVWRQGLIPWDPLMKTVGHTLLAAFFAAVLVLALTSPEQTRWGRFWSSRTLRFFGRYSYGLYVFHHPMLFFNFGALLFLDRIPFLYGSLLLKKLVFVTAATAVSIALALISWHLYEKRCLGLKRFFTSGPASRMVRPQISAGLGAPGTANRSLPVR